MDVSQPPDKPKPTANLFAKMMASAQTVFSAKEKSSHGGKREGAGRKPLEVEPAVPK